MVMAANITTIIITLVTTAIAEAMAASEAPLLHHLAAKHSSAFALL